MYSVHSSICILFCVLISSCNAVFQFKDEKRLMAFHQNLEDVTEDQLSLASIHYMRSHYQEAIDIYKRLLLQNRSELHLSCHSEISFTVLLFQNHRGRWEVLMLHGLHTLWSKTKFTPLELFPGLLLQWQTSMCFIWDFSQQTNTE